MVAHSPSNTTTGMRVRNRAAGMVECPPPINRTTRFSKKSINLENDGHESTIRTIVVLFFPDISLWLMQYLS